MAFDTEYDLVVIGSGASGKSAALTAARAGKSVVILEKMPETGGLSVFAEGTAAFESSEQKRLGKPDQAVIVPYAVMSLTGYPLSVPLKWNTTLMGEGPW